MKNIFSFFKKTLDIHLIETEENFDYIKNILNREKIFGIDTEFDWRTTYFPKLSLLQISVSKEIILIDCIKCKRLHFLKSILENKDKLFIFHSARSDATVLSNNLDVKIKNIFDTQAAEKLLNSGTVESYASLVKKYFGKDLDKSETNSNWLKRPLSENQISYASSDVEYLIKIYKIQKKLLTKRNLLKEAYELSEKEASLGNEDIKLSRFKKQKYKLSQREREIFMWRENTAQKENIPTSYLFKDKYLRNLSKLKKDEANLKSKILKILGDTKLSENFISSLF